MNNDQEHDIERQVETLQLPEPRPLTNFDLRSLVQAIDRQSCAIHLMLEALYDHKLVDASTACRTSDLLNGAGERLEALWDKYGLKNHRH